MLLTLIRVLTLGRTLVLVVRRGGSGEGPTELGGGHEDVLLALPATLQEGNRSTQA